MKIATILAASIAVCWAVAAADAPTRAPKAGNTYRTLVEDGAWCWFQDPRAVFLNGKTYCGVVNSAGDIQVVAFDHATSKSSLVTLHAALQRDDHDDPAILIRPDRRLLVLYSRHGGKELFSRLSVRPEDIGEWEEEKTFAPNPSPAASTTRSSYCYPNPQMLSAEKNRIYLFWRGEHWKPTFTFSDDLGSTWAPGRMLVSHPKAADGQRPYMKVAGNGRDTIHFAFTDGHPRNEAQNSIYYMRYKDGAFYRADGTRIGAMADVPLQHRDTDVVYDATKTNVRAWIWDVCEDAAGHPVIVYARLPAENDHRYHYARWTGDHWLDREVCAGGPWFPKTPAREKEREPHYSGGIVLDHDNPDTVYLSRQVNGVFEIEQWQTPDKGDTWAGQPVTSGSKTDNIRPFVVRNAPAGPGRLLWLDTNGKYVHYTNYNNSVKMR